MSDLQPSVMGTVFFQGLSGGFAGQVGAITVAAQVSEVNIPQLRANQLSENIGGSQIGEMAVAAGDALLDTPGTVGIILQKF